MHLNFPPNTWILPLTQNLTFSGRNYFSSCVEYLYPEWNRPPNHSLLNGLTCNLSSGMNYKNGTKPNLQRPQVTVRVSNWICDYVNPYIQGVSGLFMICTMLNPTPCQMVKIEMTSTAADTVPILGWYTVCSVCRLNLLARRYHSGCTT